MRRRAASKINNEKRTNEGILERIDKVSHTYPAVKPAFLLYPFEMK